MYFCIGLRDLCPGGGIGRHATLRGWCRFRRASSTLVLGTQNGEDFSLLRFFVLHNKEMVILCGMSHKLHKLPILRITTYVMTLNDTLGLILLDHLQLLRSRL